eukprot:7276015-Prymnesium_polylepis.1
MVTRHMTKTGPGRAFAPRARLPRERKKQKPPKCERSSCGPAHGARRKPTPRPTPARRRIARMRARGRHRCSRTCARALTQQRACDASCQSNHRFFRLFLLALLTLSASSRSELFGFSGATSADEHAPALCELTS